MAVEDPNTLTLVLSIIGTVGGIVGTAIAGLSLWKQREKVDALVIADEVGNKGLAIQYAVAIHNTGNKPFVVKRGFYTVDEPGDKPDPAKRRRVMFYSPTFDDVQCLRTGEATKLTFNVHHAAELPLDAVIELDDRELPPQRIERLEGFHAVESFLFHIIDYALPEYLVVHDGVYIFVINKSRRDVPLIVATTPAIASVATRIAYVDDDGYEWKEEVLKKLGTTYRNVFDLVLNDYTAMLTWSSDLLDSYMDIAKLHQFRILHAVAFSDVKMRQAKDDAAIQELCHCAITLKRIEAKERQLPKGK